MGSYWILFPFRDMENVLDMGGGYGCTKMRMYLMPQNFNLKMVKKANFTLCIFCQIFQNKSTQTWKKTILLIREYQSNGYLLLYELAV